jgi:hypothetical protein
VSIKDVSYSHYQKVKNRTNGVVPYFKNIVRRIRKIRDWKRISYQILSKKTGQNLNNICLLGKIRIL